MYPTFTDKDKFNEVFDYTMELYYISPVICDQVLVFGSNNVDFFHAPTYDHGIETYLYGNMHSPDTRFDLMHHYKKNIAPESKCNLGGSEGSPLLHDTAAGVVGIVEAENTSIDLNQGITSIMRSVAEDMGFTVAIDPVSEGNFGIVIMEEGYIAARLWPAENYVGFDVNLWGKTYLLKHLESSLVKAVGSTDVSSFKVVVGGMHGSSTWKEDQQLIGPKLRQLRNCKEDVVMEGSIDDKLACKVAMEEVVPLTLAHDITAAVVCGKEGEECPSLKALSDHSDVKNVIPIHECLGLEGSSEIENFIACEVKILSDLKKSLQGSSSKLHLLVLDGSASYVMHQILNSIAVSDINQGSLFHYHSIIVTWSSDLTTETWRREFLDRLRKTVEYDPAVRAEIVFQAGGKSYEMGIFSSDNENPSYDLEKFERRVQDRLPGANVELRNIHGALYRFIDDYNPTEFKQEDYDSAPGREQYAKQAPLGRQTIIQFVRSEEEEGVLKLKLNKIFGFVMEALKEVGMEMTIVRKYTVGDGGVILGLSPIGNVIVVWDGREHIDVNLFTFSQSVELVNTFKTAFQKSCDDKLVVGLRDDQPRGVGRVVNFLNDMI